MTTLYMTRGLPASGKTSWARVFYSCSLEADAPGTDAADVVTKDDIRAELETKGWVWSRENEKDVLAIRDGRIKNALLKGRDVVSADCNFGKHEERLRQIARYCKAGFEIKDFTHVPIDECISRDSLRTGKARVGEKVIREMAEANLTKDQLIPGRQSPQLFLDLDGVFADFDGLVEREFGFKRDPSREIPNDVFWDTLRTYKGRFFADLKPFPHCRELWEALTEFKPIILTGAARSIEGCYEDKMAWVAKHISPDAPIVVTQSRNKCKYAKPLDILLDDSPKYQPLWEGADGIWITFDGDWRKAVDTVRSTIRDVKESRKRDAEGLSAAAPSYLS